jgi:hypothetical protein
MNKDRFLKLSLVVLLITLILLVWNGCHKGVQLSALKKQIQKFDLKNEKFVEKINKDGNKLVQQQQIILNQKDAISNHLLHISDLKKVKSQVRIQTQFKIDSVFIPYEVTKEITKHTRDTCYLYGEKKFRLINEHYSLIGNVKQDGVLIDSVIFNNKSNITIGNKSKGFFKRSEPIVQIDYTNPYISTTSMENIVIKNELKWYERKGLYFGTGLIAGIISTIFILK